MAYKKNLIGASKSISKTSRFNQTKGKVNTTYEKLLQTSASKRMNTVDISAYSDVTQATAKNNDRSSFTDTNTHSQQSQAKNHPYQSAYFGSNSKTNIVKKPLHRVATNRNVKRMDLSANNVKTHKAETSCTNCQRLLSKGLSTDFCLNHVHTPAHRD